MNKAFEIKALNEFAVEWEVVVITNGELKTIGIITERKEGGWFSYVLRSDDSRSKLKRVSQTLEEAGQAIYDYWWRQHE